VNFQKQALKKMFDDRVQNAQTLVELDSLSDQLYNIKMIGRPPQPIHNAEVKSQGYKDFSQKYKDAATDADLDELRQNPLYAVYMNNKDVMEWKRYKSNEYKQLEQSYKQYNELTKFLKVNRDKYSLDELFTETGLRFATEDDVKIYLGRLDTNDQFKLFLRKKELSSMKYRLPPDVLTRINMILTKVATALIENALEGALDEDMKTVGISHVISKPYRIYSTYPLFKLTTPFKNLLDKQLRELEFEKNQKLSYKNISEGKDNQSSETFETVECAKGLCIRVETTKRKPNSEDYSTTTRYKWKGVDDLEPHEKLLPAITRLASKIREAKGGNILNLKVSKQLKIFVTAVVEDTIKRIYDLLKDFTDVSGVKTFSINNLNYVIKQIVRIGGETDSDIYKSLYE